LFQFVDEAIRGTAYPDTSESENVCIPEEVAVVIVSCIPPVEDVANVWFAMVELLSEVIPTPDDPASVPQEN
jgi:hypothetical protein